MYQKKQVKVDILFISFLLMFLFFGWTSPRRAFATSDVVYSSVLKDLQKDNDFVVKDYPHIDNDYSLNIIQIAESKNQELFIYIYQPSAFSKELRATKINLCIDENKLTYTIYHLTFLNSDGVFQKYKVEGFEVKKSVVRTYDIASVFRKWDKDIDKGTGNDNTINEVVFEVAKVWQIMTFDGKIYYSCYDTETVEITDKYVGFIRYYNGYLSFKACDAHYIAFSTDKSIDKLLDAEVYFVTKKMCSEYRLIGGYNEWSYGSASEKQVVLSDLDMATNNPSWLFGQKATWKRIQSVSEFVKNNNLTNAVKNEVVKKEWVLNFYETAYDGSDTHYDFFTKVSNVSILRLKFETNGVVYNLGVVDNMQQGSGSPSNAPKTSWWKTLLFWVIFGGVVLALIPFMPALMSLFVWATTTLCEGLVLVLRGLLWLFSTPFSIFT